MSPLIPSVRSIRDLVGFCCVCQSPSVNPASPLGEEARLCKRCLDDIRGQREYRLEHEREVLVRAIFLVRLRRRGFFARLWARLRGWR